MPSCYPLAAFLSTSSQATTQEPLGLADLEPAVLTWSGMMLMAETALTEASWGL